MLGSGAPECLPGRRSTLDCMAQAALRGRASAPMLQRMSRTLSTAAVAERQRLAFWTDLVCDTYVQLECDPTAGRDRIDGEIVADELATLQLSRVRSAPACA